MFGVIDYETTDAIGQRIGSLIRTEDVQISPDQSRIALTDFVSHEVVVFEFHLAKGGRATPTPVITAMTSFRSDTFAKPHGLAFAGNDHVVVCNRLGGVDVFEIPPLDSQPVTVDLEPIVRMSGKGGLGARVKTPGSTICVDRGDGRHLVLVCNNRWHFVSSHLLDLRARTITDHRIRIKEPLRLPDGIGVSDDGAILAVSNHVDGTALLYALDDDLDTATDPIAVLHGMVCPHGICFMPDGKLLVADASTPYVFLFEPGPHGWEPRQDPVGAIRIYDDERFYDGRMDAREGGPKGIAVDATGRVLITTRRPDVLSFHDLDALLDACGPAGDLESFRQQRDDQLVRLHREMVEQRWNARSRLELTARRPWLIVKHRTLKAARQRSIRDHERRLRRRNETSNEPVVAPGGPPVSMTTHGRRLDSAFYAIESIGAGDVRPGRIVLWVGDPAIVADPPESLRRLVARGLELRVADDVGPHTKYFPYLADADLTEPLVTADDDMVYPTEWLAELVSAHRADPESIHCQRAWTFDLADGHLQPYNDWRPCTDTTPSHRNFVTGVAGAIYPPRLLRALHDAGDDFLSCTPDNDDIWINVIALRSGIRVAQVAAEARNYTQVTGTVQGRLMERNVDHGQNQVQLRRTYGRADIALLEEIQRDIVAERVLRLPRR